MKLGLIGKPGSGKSTVSRVLESEHGYKVINADYISHDVLFDYREAAAEVVGTREFIGEGGIINRQVLADVVFNDKSKLEALESVLHPIVNARIMKALTEKCVIDAALLMRVSAKDVCDEIWLVDAPFDVRLERVSKSRGWSKQELVRRDEAFPSDESMRSDSDAVIVNMGAYDNLSEQVGLLFS